MQSSAIGERPLRLASLLQGRALGLQIRLDIDLGQLDVRVAEHVFDRDDRDTRLQQVHGLGMAKRVRLELSV